MRQPSRLAAVRRSDPATMIAVIVATSIIAYTPRLFARSYGAASVAPSGVPSIAGCENSLVANGQRSAVSHRSLAGPGDDAELVQRIGQAAPGIEYKIPANTKATNFAHLLSGFDAEVMFAAGRGRLDMLANPSTPTLVAEGVSVASPLAGAGDYYLFDNTGLILVRPSQRTFSSFVVADQEFNYDERRDGWPAQFTFVPAGSLKIDTLGRTPTNAPITRHAQTRIFWILKMGMIAPTLPTDAFGRLTIADAPQGEGGVARWIGATQVLADMARRGGLVDEKKVELMSYVPLAPAKGGSIDLSVRQSIICLRVRDIDLGSLTLPRGYKEAAWPGFPSDAARPRLGEQALSRWRALPRVE